MKKSKPKKSKIPEIPKTPKKYSLDELRAMLRGVRWKNFIGISFTSQILRFEGVDFMARYGLFLGRESDANE